MLCRKYLLLIIVLLVLGIRSSPQSGQASNWYFGKNAGVTFNTETGEPEAVFNGQVKQDEGCASISDSNGNLLFYTDGVTVWNCQHDTMSNGKNLLGDPSSSMSALIVPKPCHPFIYYLFTVPKTNKPAGLRYSIIDMSLDSGKGAVTNAKNVFLIGPVHEMVTSVLHDNGSSIWVVSHLWETNTFVSFLIDSDSIYTIPVTCSVGSVHQGNPYEITGYMKLSMQGDKLVLSQEDQEYFQLFNFNNETAFVDNPITFPSFYPADAYGCEFSPDGTKLYLGYYDYSISLTPEVRIIQYDLSIPDSATIINSAYTVLHYFGKAVGALQIAQNMKIYIARNNNKYLSAIEYPNSYGIDCGFIDSALYLDNGSGTRKSYYGLPAFIQSFFNPANFSWEGHCIGDTTFFAITDTASQDSVFWDFGDPPSGAANYSDSFFPYHIYEDTGAYQVSVIGYNNNLNETTEQEILVHPLPVLLLPADTGFCEAYGVNLWPGSFQSYLWQNGSTDTSFYADTTLSVIVEVTDVQGCKNSDTTQAVEHSKPEGISIFHD